MQSETITVKEAPTNQPIPIDAPPPAPSACGKAVMQPAKIQIIENEIAKLETRSSVGLILARSPSFLVLRHRYLMRCLFVLNHSFFLHKLMIYNEFLN